MNKDIPYLIIEHYQSPLGQNIQKEYNALIKVIASMNDQSCLLKRLELCGDTITVSDLIAYQIGWGTLLINWYKAGLEVKVPQMPGEGFYQWDYKGLARHFYKKYSYDTTAKQHKKFYQVVECVIKIVEEKYKQGNLDKVGIWEWCTLPSGKELPFSKWVKVNTSAHYKRAKALLRKYLK